MCHIRWFHLRLAHCSQRLSLCGTHCSYCKFDAALKLSWIGANVRECVLEVWWDVEQTILWQWKQIQSRERWSMCVCGPRYSHMDCKCFNVFIERARYTYGAVRASGILWHRLCEFVQWPLVREMRMYKGWKRPPEPTLSNNWWIIGNYFSLSVGHTILFSIIAIEFTQGKIYVKT